MGWLIGRAAAMSDPEGARKKALEKLQGISAMDDPENVVVPILIDAILLVESYRGARHQITFLDDRQRRRAAARADDRRKIPPLGG